MFLEIKILHKCVGCGMFVETIYSPEASAKTVGFVKSSDALCRHCNKSRFPRYGNNEELLSSLKL